MIREVSGRDRGGEKNHIEWGSRVRLKRLNRANLIWNSSRTARSAVNAVHILVSCAVRDIYILLSL